jgi:hypothetical protein
VEPVALSATDVQSESPRASLDVAYGATVATEIPTEPPTIANDGTKWLFVRMEVANTGDSTYEMTGGIFVIRARGDEHFLVSTKQDWELRGRTIQPGETTTGWLVFQLPSDVDEATLTLYEETEQHTVMFTQDSSLATTLPA